MHAGMLELVIIGVVRSPFREFGEAPRQGRFDERESVVEIFPEFEEGLQGIERWPHLFVIWWADRAERDLLRVTPPGETRMRGVFSTRSPARPNPVCLSLVELVAIEGRRIRVRWLDALDGSPVIDIKPYSPDIDSI